MKILKVKTAIGCEYVALGQANKHTLINTYGGDILVKEFPSTFPLAFYFELVPSFETPTSFKIELQLNQSTVAMVEAVLDPPTEPGRPSIIALPAFLLAVQNDSEVRVIASSPGQRKSVLISKKISQGQIP